MKTRVLILLLLPIFCFGLEEKPWYPPFMEFELRARYDYNFFSKVDHSFPKLRSTYNTHIIGANLELSAPATWDYQVELELGETSDVSFRYRSFALQVQKLWLDDVCGDLVSLSTGLVYRDADTAFRKALSTPYHGRANFEFHTSIGREWSQGCYWAFRTYGVFAVGQATSGKPWLRGDLYFGVNIEDIHRFRLYGLSYWGLGDRDLVVLIGFDGWGNTHHQSIDLGASYRYQFGCYGAICFDYRRRVYARSYPEDVNFFIFTLEYPFSFF